MFSVMPVVHSAAAVLPDCRTVVSINISAAVGPLLIATIAYQEVIQSLALYPLSRLKRFSRILCPLLKILLTIRVTNYTVKSCDNRSNFAEVIVKNRSDLLFLRHGAVSLS